MGRVGSRVQLCFNPYGNWKSSAFLAFFQQEESNLRVIEQQRFWKLIIIIAGIKIARILRTFALRFGSSVACNVT